MKWVIRLLFFLIAIFTVCQSISISGETTNPDNRWFLWGESPSGKSYIDTQSTSRISDKIIRVWVKQVYSVPTEDKVLQSLVLNEIDCAKRTYCLVEIQHQYTNGSSKSIKYKPQEACYAATPERGEELLVNKACEKYSIQFEGKRDKRIGFIKLSGYDWVSWNNESKRDFMNGFLTSTEYSLFHNVLYNSTKYTDSFNKEKAIELYWDGLMNITEKKNLKKTFTKQEVLLLLQEQQNDFQEYISNLTLEERFFEKMIDTLDLFYKTIDNKPINIAEAIYVAKKQMKGVSIEEIQALTGWLKKTDRTPKTRYYMDNAGKKHYIAFP
jgi:hypothetical protein